MTSRGVRAGSNATIVSLIVLAILMLANYLSASHFVRVDLTENKEYTISPSTRDILARMDDLVLIDVYFSQDLPSYLATLRRDVRDLLNEFRAFAGGSVVVQYRDPSTDPEIETKVRRLGIPQVQLDVIERDSRQIQNAYLGIAISFEDRNEVIPVVSGLETLEYDLTAAILKVLQNETKVVGYLTGHQEPALDQELASSRQMLEQQYTVRTVDLDQGRRPIPDDIHTLIIAGPTGINDRERYLIDQFVMRGGKLIVLEDAIQLVGGALQARSIRSGLESLLPFYGIKVEENLVLDRLCATAGFNSGFIRFMVPYPYWPQVTAQAAGFNQDNPVVSRLESLVLPWVSALDVSDQKPEEVEYIPLASTTDHSWPQSGAYNLNPQQQFLPTGEPQPFTVAAALSGHFTSYYAEKEIPAAPADTTQALAAVDAEGGDDETLTETITDTQIVVVGTSFFPRENFLAQFPANLTFLLNAVDWVTLGDELISIRSRSVTDRPLKPEILADDAEGQRATIKFLGTFGMPILLGGFGVARALARRREKRAFEESIHGNDRGEGAPS